MLSKIVEDNILESHYYFSEKKSKTDIPCELSAWLIIHIKCQALVSLKFPMSAAVVTGASFILTYFIELL